MLEIVMVVCTVANIYKCHEERIVPDFGEEMPFVCQARALQEAAKFIDANPGYITQRVGCKRRKFAAK